MSLPRLVLVPLLIVLACGEQRGQSFPSGAAALSSDTAKRGWLPPWLPPEAVDVQVRYDLDTNDVWVSFRLKSSSAIALQRQLRPIDDRDARRLDLQTPRGNVGWPEGIIQQQPANDGALNARLFRGTGITIPTTTYVAFDRLSDAVYVWIPSNDGTPDGAWPPAPPPA